MNGDRMRVGAKLRGEGVVQSADSANEPMIYCDCRGHYPTCVSRAPAAEAQEPICQSNPTQAMNEAAVCVHVLGGSMCHGACV